MYDAPNRPDEPEVVRDQDDNSHLIPDIPAAHPDNDVEELDAVHLDKATQASRFSDPANWRVGERDFQSEDRASSTRPSRKRITSSQPTQRRASLSQDRPRMDIRSQTDYIIEPRHRDRDPDDDHSLDPDHSDEIQPPSDTDFSRTTFQDDPFFSSIASDSEQENKSRINYKSKGPSSRQKKKRRESSQEGTSPIHESPYSHLPSRQVSSATANAESLSYNAYTDVLQSQARGDGGGLRTIVDLLRDSEGNPIVIEKAALVIGLLSEKDAATRDAFGQFAAVQTLIQCLSMRITARFDRSLIVKNVTFALTCLLRDSPRNLRLFEMFDGPYKMGKAAASDRYENKPDIPKYALRALSELKYYPQSAESVNSIRTDRLTRSSTVSRTVLYVLRAMSLHEYRTEIQECGLDALRTLISRSGSGSIDSEIVRKSTQSIGTAFKMHKESAEVRWQSLTLLCDLEGRREDFFSVDLDVECFFGALRAVVSDAARENEKLTSDTANTSLVGLLKRAITVAVNVGWRRKEFTERAVDAGAIETVLEALDFFGKDQEIVDKIYSILRVLLQSDEGKFRMNSVRSACAILAGIETGNQKAAVVLSSVSS
ncbi:unnamed protein product [Chondrus crispus]|uniref:Uncharacterized protein n=1 Tax=Chondrus crispus TaxID=2769 RepID=R7QDC5_CHOCR|nr:unnamed protein product [Chondrus crispus]CDF35788.1 unnamed protein product [Chondrus crispus]|eukprot:XP_005715607.1 unnamed protein product [Chondrus crispus]